MAVSTVSFQNIFITPETNPTPINQVLPTSPFSPPLAPTSLRPVSPELSALGVSYLQNRASCGFCACLLALRAQGTCQESVPFYGCVILLWLHHLYPFSPQWTLSCLHVLAIMNNSAWPGASVGRTYVCHSLMYPGSGVLGHVTMVYLLGKLPSHFPQRLCHFPSPQLCLRVPVSLHFLHILVRTYFPVCFLFIFNLQPCLCV